MAGFFTADHHFVYYFLVASLTAWAFILQDVSRPVPDLCPRAGWRSYITLEKP